MQVAWFYTVTVIYARHYPRTEALHNNAFSVRALVASFMKTLLVIYDRVATRYCFPEHVLYALPYFSYV